MLLFVFFFILVVYLVGIFLLKFLIVSEFIYLVVFVFFSVILIRYECSFLVVFLSLLACEASMGLSMLVGLVRLVDKINVKGAVFVGW